MILPLMAEQKEVQKSACTKDDTKLRHEVAEIQKKILQLEARLADIRKELQVAVPGDVAKVDILITALSNGDVTVDKTTLTKKALKKKLLQFEGETAGVAIVIRGGPTIKYQQIVEIIDLCQKAGFPNIRFATQRQKNDQKDRTRSSTPIHE